MLERILTYATTLPDAWFQLVYAAVKKGRDFKIDRGSSAGQIRLELDWIDIQITKPWLRDVEGLPLIPEVPEGMNMPAPVTKDYIRDYARYFMTPVKESEEQYTYGERLSGYVYLSTSQPVASYYQSQIACGERIQPPTDFRMLNQIEEIIKIYREYGPRNNQMVLQIARPEDLHLEDPPCLRHIDTRIQDGRLHFFPYFRSWDLWNGFPANLVGISMLQEYMAGEIGIEKGDMICSSKGLHIYGYAKDLAKLRTHQE